MIPSGNKLQVPPLRALRSGRDDKFIQLTLLFFDAQDDSSLEKIRLFFVLVGEEGLAGFFFRKEEPFLAAFFQSADFVGEGCCSAVFAGKGDGRLAGGFDLALSAEIDVGPNLDRKSVV